MKILKNCFTLFVFLFLSAGLANAHPYYVSVCQVEYNTENRALEISVKVFADDLILGLENAGYQNFLLGEKNENPLTGNYIKTYLDSKLKFDVDGVPVPFNFVGKEMEDGAVWLYLEATNVNNFEKLNVHCSLLTEVLDTQNNVIQVEKNQRIKSLLLNKRKTNGTVSFADQ